MEKDRDIHVKKRSKNYTQTPVSGPVSHSEEKSTGDNSSETPATQTPVSGPVSHSEEKSTGDNSSETRATQTPVKRLVQYDLSLSSEESQGSAHMFHQLFGSPVSNESIQGLSEDDSGVTSDQKSVGSAESSRIKTVFAPDSAPDSDQSCESVGSTVSAPDLGEDCWDDCWEGCYSKKNGDSDQSCESVGSAHNQESRTKTVYAPDSDQSWEDCYSKKNGDKANSANSRSAVSGNILQDKTANSADARTAVSGGILPDKTAKANSADTKTAVSGGILPDKTASHADTRTAVSGGILPDKMASYADTRTAVIRLTELVHSNGFRLVDVPGDGSCMFYAVLDQFRLKRQCTMTADQLRDEVCNFMAEHSERYSPFVAINIQLGFDSDPCSQRDMQAALELDGERQSTLLWENFLSRQRGSGYGNHITLQAIADAYCVQIHILQVSDDHPQGLYNCINPTGGVYQMEINLAFLPQRHYMSLHPIATAVTPKASTKRKASTPSCETPKLEFATPSGHFTPVDQSTPTSVYDFCDVVSPTPVRKRAKVTSKSKASRSLAHNVFDIELPHPLPPVVELPLQLDQNQEMETFDTPEMETFDTLQDSDFDSDDNVPLNHFRRKRNSSCDSDETISYLFEPEREPIINHPFDSEQFDDWDEWGIERGELLGEPDVFYKHIEDFARVPGYRGPPINSPLEIFSLLVNDRIFHEMAVHTNAYANKKNSGEYTLYILFESKKQFEKVIQTCNF